MVPALNPQNWQKRFNVGIYGADKEILENKDIKDQLRQNHGKVKPVPG
ncbi:MAG: hypothetical protein WD431_00710 [Cyclobacteriaceae bacterium]